MIPSSPLLPCASRDHVVREGVPEIGHSLTEIVRTVDDLGDVWFSRICVAHGWSSIASPTLGDVDGACLPCLAEFDAEAGRRRYAELMASIGTRQTRTV